MLNEKLLEEVTRVSGAKTYSRAVQLALEEFLKKAKAKKILGLQGSGLWEGNLSEMRADKKRKPR